VTRGERWLLRAGEFLVGRAARHLPAAVRDERYQEWAAELPVILGDPEIKTAAARAARMLWFAADTLRGAALGPGPARHRGAHRGGLGKNGVLKSAHWLGVGVALLAGLAISLAAQAFLVYQVIFGESLAGYVAFVLGYLAILAVCLLRRRPGGSTFGAYAWFGAGVVVAATGPHVSALAGHLGWDHPLPFTLISDCGYAVCAACISVAVAIVDRSARRDRRPGMQARSDGGQLGAPGRALGMPGQPRGWSGYASTAGPFAGAAILRPPRTDGTGGPGRSGAGIFVARRLLGAAGCSWCPAERCVMPWFVIPAWRSRPVPSLGMLPSCSLRIGELRCHSGPGQTSQSPGIIRRGDPCSCSRRTISCAAL
jgi:acetyltransferase-like isoleucine patch superfamily enzyme